MSIVSNVTFRFEFQCSLEVQGFTCVFYRLHSIIRLVRSFGVVILNLVMIVLKQSWTCLSSVVSDSISAHQFHQRSPMTESRWILWARRTKESVFPVYTHSYLFIPHVRLHGHSAEWTVGLLNKASRNKYPHNPEYVGDTGIMCDVLTIKYIHSWVWVFYYSIYPLFFLSDAH